MSLPSDVSVCLGRSLAGLMTLRHRSLASKEIRRAPKAIKRETNLTFCLTCSLCLYLFCGNSYFCFGENDSAQACFQLGFKFVEIQDVFPGIKRYLCKKQDRKCVISYACVMDLYRHIYC